MPFVRPAKLHVAVGAKGSLLEVEVQRPDGEAHVNEGPGKNTFEERFIIPDLAHPIPVPLLGRNGVHAAKPHGQVAQQPGACLQVGPHRVRARGDDEEEEQGSPGHHSTITEFIYHTVRTWCNFSNSPCTMSERNSW